MNQYTQIKAQVLQLKDWIIKHPKQFYKYIMLILIVSFGLIFIQYYYFTPKIPINNIPNLYSESDEVKSEMNMNENKMENVVKELQQLKGKRENGPLTKNDSLRIEYLYNQYQKLKNGH